MIIFHEETPTERLNRELCERVSPKSDDGFDLSDAKDEAEMMR